MSDVLLQIASAGLLGYVVVDSATGRAPTAPQLAASGGLAILASRLPMSLQVLDDPTTLLSRLVASYAVLAFGVAYGVSRAAGHAVRMSLAIGTIVAIGAHAYYRPPTPTGTGGLIPTSLPADNRLGFEGRPVTSTRQIVTKAGVLGIHELGKPL